MIFNPLSKFIFFHFFKKNQVPKIASLFQPQHQNTKRVFVPLRPECLCAYSFFDFSMFKYKKMGLVGMKLNPQSAI